MSDIKNFKYSVCRDYEGSIEILDSFESLSWARDFKNYMTAQGYKKIYINELGSHYRAEIL